MCMPITRWAIMDSDQWKRYPKGHLQYLGLLITDPASPIETTLPNLDSRNLETHLRMRMLLKNRLRQTTSASSVAKKVTSHINAITLRKKGRSSYKRLTSPYMVKNRAMRKSQTRTMKRKMRT